MIKAHYFLGNRLLGSSPHGAYWADLQLSCSHTIYVCRECGECWGRVVLASQPHAGWTTQLRACARHGGGSFIASWSQQFDELPEEVLEYELNLLLDHHEKTFQGSASAAGTRLAPQDSNGS